MIEKYRIKIVDEFQFIQEREAAFVKCRAALQPWRLIDPNCRIALGGDSSSAEWSVIFEDGFWLVFIGERGERLQVSIFTSVWDAVSFAGYMTTAGRGLDRPFPLLRP